MARPPSFSADDIATRAMAHFWRYGFHGASISSLTDATGLNRKALYENYNGKEGIFAASLRTYIDRVVTPAFAQVEEDGADLSHIDRFFTAQIESGVKTGLPGCFIANTMTESAPHVALFREIVNGHLARLRAGFSNALQNEASRRNRKDIDIGALAEFLTVSAQGLWTYSRTLSDPESLWTYKDNLMDMINTRLTS
ncbi:MAG: TetR/AcrR family transcriptional regulator [Pseudomonadota bacterium]